MAEQYRCPNCNYHDDRVQIGEATPAAPVTEAERAAPDLTGTEQTAPGIILEAAPTVAQESAPTAEAEKVPAAPAQQTVPEQAFTIPTPAVAAPVASAEQVKTEAQAEPEKVA